MKSLFLIAFSILLSLALSAHVSKTGIYNPGFKNTKSFQITSSDANKLDLEFINDNVIPSFFPIGDLCLSSIPPILPANSSNGISGFWSPATINTATVGITTYTFTPDDLLNADPVNVDVRIVKKENPEFNPIGPLCQNSIAPELPLLSKNSIAGSWNPDFISTTQTGTFNYTFTPNAGLCANDTTIGVIVSAVINPAFEQIGPLCPNSIPPVLPATSVNGIEGTWLPAAISTSKYGISSYTFTPGSGYCASSQQMNILVYPPILLTETHQNIGYSADAIGSIDLTVTGGSGKFTYLWSNGKKTQDINSLPNGKYTVVVTDENLCSANLEVEISRIELMTLSAVGHNVCPGSDGIIDFTFNNVPDGVYDILYDGGLFKGAAVSGGKASVLAPLGTYNNLRLVLNGNSSINKVDVTIKTLEIKMLAHAVRSECSNQLGIIEFTFENVHDGSYNITYDGGQFSDVKVIGNVANVPAIAGTYSNLTLRMNTCISNSENVILDPPVGIIPVTTLFQPVSLGSKGTIVVNYPSGANYFYSIDGGINYQDNSSFTGLEPGKYKVRTWEISSGCESEISMVTLNPTPGLVTNNALFNVCFSDQANGIAVGGGGTILITSDGGNTWTKKQTGTYTTFNDVEYIGANNWIVVGDDQIYRTSDGGKTWKSQSPEPVGKNYNITSVFFTDPNNGIILGGDWNGLQYDPLILKTTDGGKNWIRQNCEGLGDLKSVFFTDQNNGFAVGSEPRNINNSSYDDLFLRTNDGGLTWVLQPNNFNNGLVKVFFSDSNNGIILTDGDNIARTTDGGDTWVQQSAGSTKTQHDVFFSDSLNGTIVVDQDILKTNDGGKTWVDLPTGITGGRNILKSAWFFDANNGIVVGQQGIILKISVGSCPLPSTPGSINGPTTVCQGELSQIYSVADVPNATGYSWSYSGTGVKIMNASTNRITLDYSVNATSGILTVMGTNSCGDGPVSTMAITVNPIPASAGKITGVTLINPGQNSVAYFVPKIANATSYIWTLPEGATGISSTNNITINYGMSAVSGTLKVKGHNKCLDGEESSLEIKVNQAPIAIAGKDQSFDENTVISLDASHSFDPEGNILTYKWISPKGITLSSSVIGNPTFKAPEVENDTILEFILIVNDGVLASIPTSVFITLKNVVKTWSELSPLGEIKVYPNPVSDELIIETENTTKFADFEIINAVGQIVISGAVNGKTVVETSSFTPGMYLIKLKSPKYIELRKILKK